MSEIIPSDPNIKKSIIKVNKIPPFSGKDGKIFLRYRVVSEDKNRVSAWSKIHELIIPAKTQSQYSLTVTKTGNAKIHEAVLRWNLDGDLTEMQYYDIFVNINTLVGEPAITTYSYNSTVYLGPKQVRLLFNEDDVDNFSIIIQKQTFDRTIKSDQIIVKTLKQTI